MSPRIRGLMGTVWHSDLGQRTSEPTAADCGGGDGISGRFKDSKTGEMGN